jgi:hypothetical protein
VGEGRFAGTDDAFAVTPGPGPDRASYFAVGAVGFRSMYRRDALPSAPAPAAGALGDFDVFWQTFSDLYPFFAAKGVDWTAVRRRYRPQVGTRDLYDILVDMVSPLGDAHVGIDDEANDRSFVGHRPGTEFPTIELEQRIRPYIERVDFGGRPLALYANDRIGFAELPGRAGYLRPLTFRYTDGVDYDAEVSALDDALDAIRPERLRGLVIDLRLHGGGSDALALRLAARLTAHPFFAYAKHARNDPRDPTRFTRPQRLWVPDVDAPRYTGPIAILVGGSTISAGETFTQAMLNRTPRPILVGQPTQGVFSDTPNRTLPHGGLRFYLPTEQFLDRRGHAYDGTGLPPDVRTPVFTPGELSAGRDSAFARALRLLS